MNYLLLMYPGDPSVRETEAMHEECVRECYGLVDRLVANGQYVAAGILEPPTSSRRIQVAEGSRLVTDGPFTETREQFAGYLLIQADSLEEAIAIASEHPVARGGAVEVHPVKDVSFVRPAALSTHA